MPVFQASLYFTNVTSVTSQLPSDKILWRLSIGEMPLKEAKRRFECSLKILSPKSFLAIVHRHTATCLKAKSLTN